MNNSLTTTQEIKIQVIQVERIAKAIKKALALDEQLQQVGVIQTNETIQIIPCLVVELNREVEQLKTLVKQPE